MSEPREEILLALSALLATRPEVFPPAAVDEPAPSNWVPLEAVGGIVLQHAAAVQDGPPPDRVGLVRGGEGDPLEELELEAAISYGVQAKPGADMTVAALRTARRARRDLAIRTIADLIAANRTLGLGPEVWAEVMPADRQDDVLFANALPTATAVVPVRVLYTAAHAAA